MSSQNSHKIDQKEYLKKYLSGDKEKKHKKKVKKHKKASVKVIDDDDVNALNENELDDELLYGGEDAPVIVGEYIEENPDKLIKWRNIAVKEELENEIKQESASDDPWGRQASTVRIKTESVEPTEIAQKNAGSSPPRFSRKNANNSPLRRGNKKQEQVIQIKREPRSSSPDNPCSPRRGESSKQRQQSDSDQSPPRRKKRNDSVDQNPRRKKNRNESNGQSPSRQVKRNSSSDQSPPRRKNRSDSSDLSPPRRRERQSSSDQSPPRRRQRRVSRDNKPPRKITRRDSSDQSPPRRNQRRPSRDRSPARRKQDRYSRDQSPPRRMHRDRYRSPDRTRTKRHYSRSNSRDRNCNRRRQSKSPAQIANRGSRWAPREPIKSPSPPPTHGPKGKSTAKTTLDGKKAGLQDAKSLKLETEQRRRQEDQLFEQMSRDISGRDADVQVRSTGRRGKRAQNAASEDPETVRQREENERKKKAKYDAIGKGLKQIEQQRERHAEMIHEASKPLARYANDDDLDRYLREKERIDDPMYEYMQSKKKKEAKDSGEPKKPIWEGSYPENRFGIRPGYRWDGVDRSNGYEKRWFDVQSERKALQDEAYKYSVEDM